MPRKYYKNIPQVTSHLLDGGLSLAVTGTRPSILIIGPASKGISDRVQLCVETSEVSRLYGVSSPMVAKAAEIFAQTGDTVFLYCMRVGGINPIFTLEDDGGSVITITPLNYKDKEAQDRLQLILAEYENTSGTKEQRILIRDSDDESIVFDSHDILATSDYGFDVKLVLASGETDFEDSAGNPYNHAWDAADNKIIVDPDLQDSSGEALDWFGEAKGTDSSQNLTFQPTVDGTPGSGGIIKLIRTQAGDDGMAFPLIQKYAAMESGLRALVWKEFDYVLPCGDYFLDSPSIADTTDATGELIVHHEHAQGVTVYDAIDWSAGLPTGSVIGQPPDTANGDVLGWLWQYLYRGRNYMYFSSVKGWSNFEPQKQTFTLAAADGIIKGNLVLLDNAGHVCTWEITGNVGLGATKVTIDLAAGSEAVTETVPGELIIGIELASNESSVDASMGGLSGTAWSITALSGGGNNDPFDSGVVTSASDFAAGATTLVAETLTYKIAFDFQDGAVDVTHDSTAGTAAISDTTGTLSIDYGSTDTLVDLKTVLDAYIATNPTGGFTVSDVAITPSLASVQSGNASLVTTSGDSGSAVFDAPSSTASFWEDTTYDLPFSNNFINHKILTGATEPSAVLKAFKNAKDAEFKECSFTHQLGTFCHKASTTWKTVMGIMTFQNPESISNQGPDIISEWVGQEPVYTSISGDLAIDNISEGGTGILGWKFSAGAPAYRDTILGSSANSSDGYAYGGLIVTNGSSNQGKTDPYGIDDSDEATDERGYAIDIGKYLVPCSMWLTHNHRSDNGEGPMPSYTSDISGTIAGKLAVTAVNVEPIGVINGAVAGISGNINTVYSIENQDSLTGAGYVTVGWRMGFGTYITGLRTLAHRYSDYRKVSTIRSVNKVVQGIRSLAEGYIGLEYSTTNVVSLKTAINGYIRAEQSEGTHNGAVCQIAFSTADRLLGNINIKLTMIPPFAIEAITLQTSLTASESNL